MRIGKRDSLLAETLLNKSQRPKNPRLISEWSVLGEHLTQRKCWHKAERGTVVVETMSHGSSNLQLPA